MNLQNGDVIRIMHACKHKCIGQIFNVHTSKIGIRYDFKPLQARDNCLVSRIIRACGFNNDQKVRLLYRPLNQEEVVVKFKGKENA